MVPCRAVRERERGDMATGEDEMHEPVMIAAGSGRYETCFPVRLQVLETRFHLYPGGRPAPDAGGACCTAGGCGPVSIAGAVAGRALRFQNSAEAPPGTSERRFYAC